MSLLKRMLSKEPSKRPTVRQIIDSDYIRSQALLLKIELPRRHNPARQRMAIVRRPSGTSSQTITPLALVKQNQSDKQPVISQMNGRASPTGHGCFTARAQLHTAESVQTGLVTSHEGKTSLKRMKVPNLKKRVLELATVGKAGGEKSRGSPKNSSLAFSRQLQHAELSHVKTALNCGS